MANLDDAITLAVQAHHRQKDKAGAPYILHPLRVMLRMKTEEEMTAAILHDVIEDTQHTLQELRDAGYSEAVVEAVDALTRRDNESYEEFTQRVKQNPMARRIKLADLEDNMDIRRFAKFDEQEVERLKKYWRAWTSLTEQDPAKSSQLNPDRYARRI